MNFKFKEPHFMFMLLVKSYTTFIRPNFISEVAQKAIVHRRDFRTRHQVLT